MSLFSCVVIGNESLLIGCSETLLSRGHVIRSVVTTSSEIRDWAEKRDLTVHEDITALTAGFDWLLSIANLSIIPQAVLDLPTKGAINFHDGPLPRYAGLNTPVWALINREARHGVTWHLIDGGVDEGDILAQAEVEITAEDTAFSLNSKCYAAAMDSFGAVVDQLESDTLNRLPQDLAQRSYFGLADLPVAAGRLDFRRSRDDLIALVRALNFGDYANPVTCAKIAVGDTVLTVGTADPSPLPVSDLPGTVIAVERDTLVVATGDGALCLGLIQRTDGTAAPLTDLVQAAMVLPSPEAEEIARLSAAMEPTRRAETHWRKALQGLRPVAIPLTHRGGSDDWHRLRLSLPDDIDADSALISGLIWALSSSGEDIADLALTHSAIAQASGMAPGYLSDWVPVRISAGETLSQLRDRLQSDIARAAKSGGFACDLLARDPAITNVKQPDIGIALAGAPPIPGTCATLAIEGDRVALHVNRARLGEEETELLAKRLETTVASVITADHEAKVATIETLPSSELRQVLHKPNATACAFDDTGTLHHAFEAQVTQTPDAPALVFETTTLSYAELNARANAVAQQLLDAGVKSGDHVGLFLRRSPDLVISALAVLKAGAAYVPLDPAYPADRLAHYLSDSQASAVLTQPDLKSGLPETTASVLIPTDKRQVQNVDGGAGPDDLAYLIYTSGSTGTPKGVMLEHRNVMNFFTGMDDRIPHAPGDTWLAVTSLNFDISVLELFWTLARGFKVVLIGDENRAVVSNGPLKVSDRHIDFNLMYWGNDDGAGPKKYELLLEGAKFADQNGFNAVWTPERHFHAFGGPYPNPSVTGAAVAAVTNNISVRAGSCVAPLHHPARIAEEWAVIDNLTNGRAALGIASGWQPDDFILRPENTPPANKPAMFETIETLRKLWRGEAIDFPRADGSLHAVITQPRPVSRELPVWVTTAGNPDTWREAGQIGANVLTHLLGQSIEEVADKIRIYHAALREAGHDPADFSVTLMLHTYLANTRETAMQIAREPMKDYLRSAAGLIKQYAWAFPAFKKPEGVNTPLEMDLGVLSGDELEAILDFAFERYFNESGLFGTVEDALARVEQLKRIGVDEIACLIDYGIAPQQVLDGLTPLAEVLEHANAPSALSDDDHSLAALILRHEVTHLQCTPSMARIIAMNDEARMALHSVKHLLLGGEALPGELVEDLRECTSARIENMYGPTETTIWSTTETVPAGAQGIVNVGSPIANTGTYVLDAQGQPCPVGVPGELFIGGEGVARGYWQRPDLTADRFVPDPFAVQVGLSSTRMYRTGDLVRWRMDGRLDYIGRTDHQVKIRGQRIELGEIETALAATPGITAAVVVAKTVGPDTRLIGYVTTETFVDTAAALARMSGILPEAMVPSQIVTLPEFPLTPNKKIDRKALPDPKPAAPPSQPAQTAATNGSAAERIAQIWSQILGVTDIRETDNFFSLGGHSLLAVQAHRDIRNQLNKPDLSITDIFRFPVLGDLARHILASGDTPPAAETAPDLAPDQDQNQDRSATMSKRRAMRDRRKARHA